MDMDYLQIARDHLAKSIAIMKNLKPIKPLKFQDRPELEGTYQTTELPFLNNDLVGYDNQNIVNSENVISAYKVFDEMPDQIRDEVETQFGDIYICETILSEKSEQDIASHEVNDNKIDTIIMVNNDVIMDDSSNLNFWLFKNEFGSLSLAVLVKNSPGEVMEFQSFSDILYFGDFWGQKSWKEGVLGMEMVMKSFGWKPGWSYSITHIGTVTWLKNGVDRFCYEFVTLLKEGMNLCSYEFLGCQDNSGRIGSLSRSIKTIQLFCAIESFGWKPGWNSVDDQVDVETNSVDGVDGWPFHLFVRNLFHERTVGVIEADRIGPAYARMVIAEFTSVRKNNFTYLR